MRIKLESGERTEAGKGWLKASARNYIKRSNPDVAEKDGLTGAVFGSPASHWDGDQVEAGPTSTASPSG